MALQGANDRLTTIRQRMVDWANEGGSDAQTWSKERRAFDRRFRDAVAADLDLPAALVVMNEAIGSSSLPPGEKHALLSTWDHVLGLDLDRLVREEWEPSAEVMELVRRRDDARARGDFASADALRDQLQGTGLEVMDTPEGTKVRPKRA